jgi:hypothetical protein
MADGAFTGRDAANLVTAEVDTDGLVKQVQFGSTAGSRAPALLEQAVLDAVGAGRQQWAQARVAKLTAKFHG